MVFRDFKNYVQFFSFLFFFLAARHGLRDLNSQIRGRTHAPCSGSAEPKQLDRQGIPYVQFLKLNQSLQSIKPKGTLEMT